MLVLHSSQVQGMCWENKSPWSLLLPTLHQQCLSLLDTFVLLSVEWFPARAHFSSSWKESRWGDCPAPSVFLRSHPAYRYSCIMLGSLSGVWLNLNTSSRFLSSQFSALTPFHRVRSLLMCMLMLAEETNFLLIEEEWLWKHYSGTARATNGPLLNWLMPCLCKYCCFCHCLGVTIDCNWNILEMGRRRNLV